MKNVTVCMIGLMALSGCGRMSEDAWRKEWEATANATEANVDRAGYLPFGWHDGEIGPETVNRPPYEGKDRHAGMMILHPISANEPARLRYRAAIPPAAPMLVVTAAGNVQGDTILRCLIGGEVIGEYVLDGVAWKTCVFDLTAFQHRVEPLELHVAAGGVDPWKFEHGFIDRIEFRVR